MPMRACCAPPVHVAPTARPHARQLRTRVAKLPGRRNRFIAALPLLALLCFEAPALADIGASISVQSDARFRGRSLGRGRPTASLALSYDGPEGVYLGATAL